MSGGYLGKARWASMRGDYSSAGDLYRLGGEMDKALKMYLKGRRHRDAAEIAREMGNLSLASRQYELCGKILEAAECAQKSGDRPRAAKLFAQAGQVRRAASVHEEGGKPEAAATLYEHCGDRAKAVHLYLEARKPERAERLLEALFEDEHDQDDRREILGLAARCGQAFLASGRPEMAGRWLERAGLSREAGRAWQRAGRADRAVRAYLAAGDAEQAACVAEDEAPGSLDASLAAEAFRAAGRWAEAGALYLESGNPSEAAVCLERLGCVAEAAWAYEAAGDHMAAAGSLERVGEHAAAAEQYRQAGAIRECARCLEAAGRLAEAAPAYLESGLRLQAAELFERLGQVDTAVEVLQSMSGGASEEDQPKISLMLGRLFERKGMDSLAAEHFRRALADEPEDGTNLEAWYQLAGVLERMGRVPEAIQALRRVVSAEVSFRDATRRLATLEQRAATHTAGHRTALPERYSVEEEIDSALPGKTFRVRDTVMNRDVVLRRFGRDVIPNEKARDRVLADVRRISQLHHPAIAAIIDAGYDDEGLYIIREEVQGQPLRSLLDRETRLDVPRAVQILTRVAEALDYAHGLGLLARSLRPESIMIGASGEARIVDFGFAFRQTDNVAADVHYRPPEIRRSERMDPSSDIYLLGICGWEMLFGTTPPVPSAGASEPPEPPSLDDRPIPDVLRKVVVESLVPDRAHRLPSAQRLLEELHGTHLLPGALLANRYEIIREIGRGGMGTVFQARDLVLDEPVALKVLGGVLDENTEKRFIQEIRLTRQINHPNIVRVHTFEHWRELRFIVLEYIDGVDLRRWAESRHPIPLSRALEIVAGVAAGLSAAHRLGIVHRDVKPENVLLDAEGRPRLVDFGIARQGDVHLTQEGLVMGSPSYMAPEQIRGATADQRADLYALGILAYFLVAGQEPFCSDDVRAILQMQVEQVPSLLSEVRPGVPEDVAQLIARTLEKEPARRPASVFAFLEELTAVRAKLTVVTA
jgi:serine/threonine protein kinase/tetratricopeptide (TPR) repeat protein